MCLHAVPCHLYVLYLKMTRREFRRGETNKKIKKNLKKYASFYLLMTTQLWLKTTQFSPCL